MKRSTIVKLMAGGIGCGILLLQAAIWLGAIAAAVWVVKAVWY